MKMYIELWKAKQAWTDLSQEERGNYMTQLGPAIQQLVESGVEIINWGAIDKTTYNKVDYDFFAVWKFPSQESAESFEKLVEGAGWYNYFDQVNAMGNPTTAQEVIGQLITM